MLDRGLLRDGFKADVVAFDAKTVKAPTTRTQPTPFPIGVDYVIVNGQVVVDGGRQTGVLAGRALRRGRASTEAPLPLLTRCDPSGDPIDQRTAPRNRSTSLHAAAAASGW
jgi:hypothetical protein